jgi:hypothetical protein
MKRFPHLAQLMIVTLLTTLATPLFANGLDDINSQRAAAGLPPLLDTTFNDPIRIRQACNYNVTTLSQECQQGNGNSCNTNQKIVSICSQATETYQQAFARCQQLERSVYAMCPNIPGRTNYAYAMRQGNYGAVMGCYQRAQRLIGNDR